MPEEQEKKETRSSGAARAENGRAVPVRERPATTNEEMKSVRQDPPASTPDEEMPTAKMNRAGLENTAPSTTHASSRSLLDGRPDDSSCEDDGEFLPPSAFSAPRKAKKSTANSSKAKDLYTSEDDDDIRDHRGRRHLHRNAPRQPAPVAKETKKRRMKFNEKQEEIIKRAAQLNSPQLTVTELCLADEEVNGDASRITKPLQKSMK